MNPVGYPYLRISEKSLSEPTPLGPEFVRYCSYIAFKNFHAYILVTVSICL